MQAQKISFRYENGSDFVLKDASFGIKPGEHIALIGPNGSGKSTLLKILVGELKIQSGNILHENHETLYLPQEINIFSNLNVKDWLFKQLNLENINKKIENLIKHGLEKKENLEKWGELRQRFELLDGDAFEINLEKAMHQIPLINFSVSQKVSTLSGGQIQRLKLLLIALAKHDIILMDEPTNDLDRESIDWLEKWIQNTKSGIVIVSHDRHLLNKVINHIAAIDPQTRKIYKAKSSYGDFLKQVESMRHKLSTEYDRQQKNIKELKKKISEAQSKANRGLGKKNSSDKDKLGRNYRAERGANQSAAKVKKLKQELANIVTLELPKHYEMRFDYEIEKIKSPTAIHFENLTTQLGNKKFGPYSGNISSNDKLSISGPNGIGKTTFLKMLFGEIETDGKVNIAKDANIFFMQQSRWLSSNQTVWNMIFKQIKILEGEAKSRLTQYGIPEDMWSNNVANLSPGERTRLLTCLINLKKPNLLVLDEPTNHMDTEAIESLEKGLNKFSGTLIVVSHDQTFLKNIGINKTWEIASNKIKLHS